AGGGDRQLRKYRDAEFVADRFVAARTHRIGVVQAVVTAVERQRVGLEAEVRSAVFGDTRESNRSGRQLEQIGVGQRERPVLGATLVAVDGILAYGTELRHRQRRVQATGRCVVHLVAGIVAVLVDVWPQRRAEIQRLRLGGDQRRP